MLQSQLRRNSCLYFCAFACSSFCAVLYLNRFLWTLSLNVITIKLYSFILLFDYFVSVALYTTDCTMSDIFKCYMRSNIKLILFILMLYGAALSLKHSDIVWAPSQCTNVSFRPVLHVFYFSNVSGVAGGSLKPKVRTTHFKAKSCWL